MLESKKIDFELIDIAAPANEDKKMFMRANAVPKEGSKTALPPQVFSDEDYCGVIIIVSSPKPKA